jgi:hypothetical protein
VAVTGWGVDSAKRNIGERLLLADSVEKVGSAAAGRSDVPAVKVAASHFELPFGVSLSFLAQV